MPRLSLKQARGVPEGTCVYRSMGLRVYGSICLYDYRSLRFVSGAAGVREDEGAEQSMGLWVNRCIGLWVYGSMGLYVCMFMTLDLSPALPVSVKTSASLVPRVRSTPRLLDRREAKRF